MEITGGRKAVINGVSGWIPNRICLVFPSISCKLELAFEYKDVVQAPHSRK